MTARYSQPRMIVIDDLPLFSMSDEPSVPLDEQSYERTIEMGDKKEYIMLVNGLPDFVGSREDCIKRQVRFGGTKTVVRAVSENDKRTWPQYFGASRKEN